MSKPSNRFETMAREAAERIEAARQLGQQLDLLPADPAQALDAPAGRGVAKRAKGLGAWLAAQGYRDPAEVLAEMAGLASRDDAVTTAMREAERICMWLGVTDAKSRLAVFMQFYSGMIRSNEALMAYTHGKVDKPAPPQQAVQVVVHQPTAPGDGARVVNPARASGVRHAPPPLPHEVQPDQGVRE